MEKIAEIFELDLNRLKNELSLYPTEESLWIQVEGITNSGGNLALHILGNLQHFIGAILGKSGYLRDRPAEFTARDIPKAEILKLLETTKKVVSETVMGISQESLYQPYPKSESFRPQGMTTLQALMIISGHLNYHLGQINYHRRLLA